MTTPSTLHPRERGSVRAGDPDASQWAADSITNTFPSQAEVLSAIRRSGRRARLLTLTKQGRAAA